MLDNKLLINVARIYSIRLLFTQHFRTQISSSGSPTYSIFSSIFDEDRGKINWINLELEKVASVVTWNTPTTNVIEPRTYIEPPT